MLVLPQISKVKWSTSNGKRLKELGYKFNDYGASVKRTSPRWVQLVYRKKDRCR